MKKSWYRRSWVAIAALVCLPPVGIVLTWLTDWPSRGKLKATGAGGAHPSAQRRFRYAGSRGRS
ncbi:MAG: hypothetical protein AAFN08_07800 [Cyanobacteria bacterium J06559_3]